MIATRIASGMELETMTMLRQLPRKKRIISETRIERQDRLAQHAFDRGAHEDRLVEVELELDALGRRLWICGSASRAASTTARVEASACLRMAR